MINDSLNEMSTCFVSAMTSILVLSDSIGFVYFSTW